MKAQDYFLGLYGGGRLAGIGVVVMNAQDQTIEQCTLLGFGQNKRVYDAIALLAKFVARYQIEVIGIGNGVMFQEIDTIVRVLMRRYPDMPLRRMPIDEASFKDGIAATKGAKAVAFAVRQQLVEDFKWPKQNKETSRFKDLNRGVILEGMVVQVKAFGALVDIGVDALALLHASQIKAALDVGQVVRVKVSQLDEARHRIGLSLADSVSSKAPQRKAAAKPFNTAMADALSQLKRGKL